MGRLLCGIPWIYGILLIINSDLAHSQRRTSRLTSSRTFGINTKSNPGSEFDCPEEFGYYPHPTDCSQYYVCVFGGALLESCTGGLMYSHELQTCDWPRNVGCEVVDGSSSQQQQQSIIPTQPAREVTPRIPLVQSQQQQQIQQTQQQPIQQTTIAPQRIRFSQQISTSAPQQLQQASIIQQQQQQQQQQLPSQRTLARQQAISSIPQPEFPAPNPIITSRGQPKSFLDSQEDIAKLYAEAHDTLPPAEEKETDRQQRVYRGQPSTLGQVQRDRDGIIHHANVNALPTHGKIGSFAFGSAINQYSTTPQPSNIFVQQPQRQKPVAEQQNTRNFYNTSNQSYDTGSYDSFYSVYDDDVDLYRDVEYTNQQHQQQQQQQSQQPAQQQQQQSQTQQQQTSQNQYNTQRGRPQPIVTSTYRAEIITTPSPQVPVRETYITKQQTDVHQQSQQQSEPNYDQPSLTYSSEYDDALISQISDDQGYNQPTRNPARTRNRGGVHYTAGNGDRDQSSGAVTPNRGTHPPRTRPTLKAKGTIVSKAVEFVDIYKNPPTRPEPLYPQPTPDKTAAKCRKDVCLLPDCSCGGKETPGDITVESIPQIVLLTFDDSVNDLNKQLYSDLFEKGRVNPNGCPITATFYVSHEWTDYSQVQNLYADGHEMASHTVSHSFGEQFSQKKWTREIAGQREILSAYGGVKLSDVRGMRAPFLSIGGNKMFKMLYDSNFTYDSSMPVYENRPPSWPYTLDYKIFHDCMIPPCPTKSYPGVWEVPMVMWQDLNGGRCSMGDACANPPDSEGVTKMLMKNFDRHYSTNRAPFGLFYHAAWFTQPHHKEGFIKFLDTINAMDDVWIVTNWQALQWVRDPTPLSRIKQFQPFQCDYSDRPKRCNNPKVCNLWHKSGVRYMRTCQPCPDIYPWTGKTGIRSSRIDNDIEE